MSWNRRIRQTHRWVSIVFVLAVVAVTVASLRPEDPAEWIYLSPLLPLAVLGLTGLYLFALPWVARRRGPSDPTEGA